MVSENNSFDILSVNISSEKGTIKMPVPEILINSQGVAGDAHAGNWNRQVSLLGSESIRKFNEASDRITKYGEFAENITTRGIELYHCAPLDRLIIGQVELEVTQIGKECHGTNCSIFLEAGNCIMPKEGIFCRVITPGIIRPGDKGYYFPKIYKIQLITLSDRASIGIYPDKSGPRMKELVSAFFSENNLNYSVESLIIPDDAETLKALLTEAASDCDLIITTGGTGIGPKDITPDVVKQMLDKEIPGIMELIRVKYGSEKPAALLSRSIAGLIKNSLIYTLPGSVKAVNEYMEVIIPTLLHSFYMLHGLDLH